MLDLVLDAIPYVGLAILVYVVGDYIWGRLRPPPPMDAPAARAIRFPLPEGAWQAYNSPATKVPSHGTKWLGQEYAVDLVGIVPGEGHALIHDWRSRFWLEPPERFHGFGTPVLAPGDGVVVSTYDGMHDRYACRSWPGIAWFFASSIALGLIALAWRTPAGMAAVAGNHVVIERDDGTFVSLMHLQRGSVLVRAGERVIDGEPIARVGNTGNTTQPHLHIQLTHRGRPRPDRGDAMVFDGVERFDSGTWQPGEPLMPADGECVRAMAFDAPPAAGRHDVTP